MELEQSLTILRLEKLLYEERCKRKELEEMCDILALENERLRGLSNTSSSLTSNHQSRPSETSNTNTNTSSDSNSNSNTENSVDWDSLLSPGDDSYPEKEVFQIPKACDGKNVVAVVFISRDIDTHIDTHTTLAANNTDTSSLSSSHTQELIACGGVDASISIYPYPYPITATATATSTATNATERDGHADVGVGACVGSDVGVGGLVWRYVCTSPVLSLTSRGNILAASLMDGTLVVVHTLYFTIYTNYSTYTINTSLTHFILLYFFQVDLGDKRELCVTDIQVLTFLTQQRYGVVVALSGGRERGSDRGRERGGVKEGMEKEEEVGMYLSVAAHDKTVSLYSITHTYTPTPTPIPSPK